VSVDSVISCADHIFGNGITEQDGHDTVRLGVGVVLVEGDQNQGALHEVGVLQERSQPALEKLASDGDGAVVGIISHVGRNERPLRKGVGCEILLEPCEVLDDTETLRAVVGLIDDGWVVLADVIIRVRGLVEPRVALEASVWHIFLVFTPRDPTSLEEVDNSADVLRNGVEVVVVHAEVVTTDTGDVVGL